MIFSTAKRNLIAQFEARFSKDPKGNSYIFYPKEYERGFACSENDFLKYTSDFQKFFKWVTRIMWTWFLLGMPLIIGLAVWHDYEISTIEQFIIISLPIPFLIRKGYRLYQAPNILMKNRPIAKQRTAGQIKNDRIRGMSWPMLLALALFPYAGAYILLNDASLEEWQKMVGLCFVLISSGTGIYLLIRKSKL